MNAIYNRAAKSVVVLSMFAIAVTAGSAAASSGGPNDAYLYRCWRLAVVRLCDAFAMRRKRSRDRCRLRRQRVR